MIKLFLINPFIMSYKKYFHLFTLSYFSVYSSQNDLEQC